MACKRVNIDPDRELNIQEVFPKAKSLFATASIRREFLKTFKRSAIFNGQMKAYHFLIVSNFDTAYI